MIKIRDRWVRLLVILLPFLAVLFANDTLDTPNADNINRSLISLCATIVICEGSRYLTYRSHQWFPGRFRLLLLFLCGIVWTGVFLAISIVLRKYAVTGIWDFTKVNNSNIIINNKKLIVGLFGYALMNAVVNFSMLVIIYEIVYHRAKLRYTTQEKEKLEKEKLKAELLQLKGIVNPHFLFNNLNSLSSLISEDPTKAQEFLDELTKVFRYLLRNNQTELTTVAEELKFIQTYYHLLRTRYGSGISLDLKINSSYDSLLIPPLTLQLLIENAVKHNKVQKENPLRIEIVAEPGNKLVVRNSICRKEGNVDSTGIGLQNINGRYKLLNLPGVSISQDGKIFTAIIALAEENSN